MTVSLGWTSLSLATDIVLLAYIGWEVIGFVSQYRQLKQRIANGDPEARNRVYQRGLIFEWITAALALVALRFDWSLLSPKNLGLENSALMQSLSPMHEALKGVVAGLFLGALLGGIAFAIIRRRGNRRGAVPAAKPAGWRSRMMPDFSALIPVTGRERIFFAALAVSAGICEEVVFRGWLLATLHSVLGLNGTALVALAAAIFGMAHAYQKVTGVILTGLVGFMLCVLYIMTGSLLLPILLHIVIDLRFAFMPAPVMAKPEAAYA
jgi:membrane protease YdiL (CAAX protease family)